MFTSILTRYFVSHPEVVQRLASLVLHGLVEHIAPSTASSLAGEASASPVAAPGSLGPVFAGTPDRQVISR